MMNVGSRLQGLAPVGGVLIGADTYRRLGANADVEPRLGLVVKGKQSPVDAYILKAVPTPRIPKGRHVEIAY
jgi:class 3 adenylate cyclase